MMKLHVLRSIYLLVLISFSGCNSSLSPDNFVKWFNKSDNGLHVSKLLEGVHFKLSYLPAEYQYLLSHRGEKLSLENFKEELKEHRKNLCFKLKVKNPKEFKEYALSGRKNQVSFGEYVMQNLQQDLKLVVNGEELPCLMSHCESMLLDGSIAITMMFTNPGFKQGDLCFIKYTPNKRANQVLSFDFDHMILTNIPSLKLD